jgi:hypothetical protein
LFVLSPILFPIDDRDIAADIRVNGQLLRKTLTGCFVCDRHDALQFFAMLDRIYRTQCLLKLGDAFQLLKRLLGRRKLQRQQASETSVPPTTRVLHQSDEQIDRGPDRPVRLSSKSEGGRRSATRAGMIGLAQVRIHGDGRAGSPLDPAPERRIALR